MWVLFLFAKHQAGNTKHQPGNTFQHLNNVSDLSEINNSLKTESDKIPGMYINVATSHPIITPDSYPDTISIPTIPIPISKWWIEEDIRELSATSFDPGEKSFTFMKQEPTEYQLADDYTRDQRRNKVSTSFAGFFSHHSLDSLY